MSTEIALAPASAPGAGNGDAPHLTLEISGMTCASCVRRVERALAGVPGVAGATVNLAAESADVTLGGLAEPGALIAAVTDAGYQAAVPAVVRADDVARRRAAQAAELCRRRVRLGAGAVLSAAVVAVAYGFAAAPWAGWAQLALTLPVYLWVGSLFHRGALEAARHRTTNMDTLVSLGATVAFGYSAIATIALPGRLTYSPARPAASTAIPRTRSTSRPRHCAPATSSWCARARPSPPTASWPRAPAPWMSRC